MPDLRLFLRIPLVLSFTIFSGFFLLQTPGIAAELTVRWAQNQENDLAGYQIYFGKNSGAYGSPSDVGLTTQHTIANLTEGARYYFAVTAYDAAGNESVPSQEVSAFATVKKTGSGSGTFPPPLSTPAPSSTLTRTSVVFTGGHTTQDLEHWLYVGTSVGAKNLHTSGSLGTGHTTTVSGLPTSGTLYVRWWSRNSSGWQSQDHTYTMKVGGN